MILNKVNFYTGQIVNNCIYASQSFFNGLIKVDLNTNTVKYIMKFPNEKIVSTVLYRFSYLYNNYIFFVPCEAKHVAIFNIENESIEMIPIYKYSYNYDNRKSYFVLNNKLFLVPVSGNGDIISINMDTFELNTFDIRQTPFSGNIVANISQDKSNIYFGIDGKGEVINYSIVSKEIRRIKGKCLFVDSVSKSERGIWILASEGDVLTCVEEKDIKYYPKKIKDSYVNIIDYDYGEILIPYDLGFFWQMKRNSDCFERVDISSLKVENNYSFKGSFSYDLIQTEEKWILPPYNTNKMLVIDKKSGIIDGIDLKFDYPVELQNSELEMSILHCISKEKAPLDLTSFIELI